MDALAWRGGMAFKGVETMVYEWKVPKYRLPAQKAGEELERIERKHGVVTPRNVLEESRPGKAILHDLFEWNDSRAAERFRLEQAQEIIGNIAVVHVVQDAPRTPVRAFVKTIRSEDTCRLCGFLRTRSIPVSCWKRRFRNLLPCERNMSCWLIWRNCFR